MISRSTASASKLVLAVLLLLAADAWGAKRVAVLKFEGRGADDAQAEVEDLVQRDGTLISPSAFARAQRRLAVKRLSESGMAKIAVELGADAFVEGSLERARGRRGGYTLLITVREGKTGAVSDTLAIRMRSPRMDSDSKADLAEKLVPALAKITDLSSEEPIDITPPPQPPARPEAETEAPPLDRAAPAEEPGEGPGEGIDGAPRPIDEMARHRWARHPAIDVELGAGAALRKLSFTYFSGLAPEKRPNGYSGGVVPALVLVGEIYPIAFTGKPGPASGIGVGFELERVFLLKSKLSRSDKEYPTSQMHYGGGLRYRYNFGSKATLPSIKVIAGFNKLDFTIERGSDANLIQLPNVSYTYLDLGAAVRLPLATPNAAVYLDARYLLVLSSGEIQEKMFYGGGGVLGIDADAGIELQFLRRAVIKVGVRYQRIAFDFDGTGTMSNDRDGDLATQDVGGALDQYFFGHFTAGYLF